MSNASHYPSLEICKKLTEVGFPKTEMYIWEYRHTQLNKEFEVTIRDNCYEWDYETFKNVWFCPSVMELLDELPSMIRIEKLCILKTTKLITWLYRTAYVDWSWIDMVFSEDTYPNSLVNVWLVLKENDLLPKK